MTQQQPPSEPKQHPCRCETCDIHKKVCSDLPHYYGKGSGNPSSGCKLYDMMDTEPDFSDAYWNAIALVGCASHSSNTSAQSPERYTGACAIQDKCMDYADFIESIMDEIDNEDDDDVPCPIKCEKRVNPYGDTGAQARIDAVVWRLQQAKNYNKTRSWLTIDAILDESIALLKREEIKK